MPLFLDASTSLQFQDLQYFTFTRANHMSSDLVAMASLRDRGKLFVLLLVLVTMSDFREGEGAKTCVGRLSTFAKYAGKNSKGSDYSHLNSTSNLLDTFASCQTTCVANCSCVAFSFGKTYDDINYTCWFKNALVSTSNLTITTTEVLYVRQNASLPPPPPPPPITKFPPPSTISPPPPAPPPPSTLSRGVCSRRFDDYTKYNNTRLQGYDIEQVYLSGSVNETLDECKELCTADCDCVAFNLVAGYYGDSVCSKKYYVTASSTWQTFEDYELYVRSVGGPTCVAEGKMDQYADAILETTSLDNDLPYFCSPSPIENYARTQCQEICSADCSCVGFAFWSTYRCCYPKYLIKNESSRENAADVELYIRINTSPPPLPYPPPPPPYPPPAPPPSPPADNKGFLIGIVVGSAAVVFCLLALLGCCYFRYIKSVDVNKDGSAGAPSTLGT